MTASFEKESGIYMIKDEEERKIKSVNLLDSVRRKANSQLVRGGDLHCTSEEENDEGL